MIGVVGCGHAYRPGTVETASPGRELTAGCLDLALAGERDPYVKAPVLEVVVGNRCHRAQPIDFSAIALTGHSGGEVIPLRFHDPDDEIEPGVLDARSVARERFELVGGDALTRVCVELSEFAPGAPREPVCTAVPAPAGPGGRS